MFYQKKIKPSILQRIVMVLALINALEKELYLS